MPRTPVRLVAFLRAINVGGHVVKMDVLKKHFEALGFTDVQTFIASGNVIFTAPGGDRSAIEKKIEKRLESALGYEVRTFVRTVDEVAAIATYEAFRPAAVKTARSLNVGFLADPLDAAALETLQTLENEIDGFHVNGREVYWICKTLQSESTMSNMRFEKVMKTRVTFRGLKTIVKLTAKHPPAPAAKGRR